MNTLTLFVRHTDLLELESYALPGAEAILDVKPVHHDAWARTPGGPLTVKTVATAYSKVRELINEPAIVMTLSSEEADELNRRFGC